MTSILKVDTIQDIDGNNIINESSDTITIGASGDTITVPSGASMTVPNGGLSGQNYPAFEANLSADQSLSDAVGTKVQFNTEVFDTDNCYDNSVNYRFTPSVAGKYFVYSSLQMEVNAQSIEFYSLNIYKNGVNYFQTLENPNDTSTQGECLYAGITIDLNGSTDYIEIFGFVSHGTGSARLESGIKSCTFGAYRIGA